MNKLLSACVTWENWFEYTFILIFDTNVGFFYKSNNNFESVIDVINCHRNNTNTNTVQLIGLTVVKLENVTI